MQQTDALSLGAFLNKARREAGLTMRGLARAVGKDHKHISLIESGKVSPTVDTLRQICSAMSLEPWEAVAGYTKAELARRILGPTPPTDPLVAELHRLAAKPDGREVVAALITFAKAQPGKVRDLLRIIQALREA